MFELDDFCHRLLQAIVSAPLAWQSPDQLATRLGVDLDLTTDALANLDQSGWIDPWEMEDVTYVTLSPAGAERLRVRLVMIGRSDTMRWASIDEPDLGPPRASGRHEGLSALDFVADPTPGPEVALASAERFERLSENKFNANQAVWIDLLPRPLLLLGSGLTPWPGPGRKPGQPCPGCGSGPIAESAYCLVCDRWGLDDRLAARNVKVMSSPRSIRNPLQPSANPSAAKSARRAKRRQKWDEKVAKARAMKPRPVLTVVQPTPAIDDARQPRNSGVNPARSSALR